MTKTGNVYGVFSHYFSRFHKIKTRPYLKDLRHRMFSLCIAASCHMGQKIKTELMVEIYSKSLVRTISKIFLMGFS